MSLEWYIIQKYYCSNTEVYCPSNDILYKSIIVVIRRYIVPRMISFWTRVLVLYDIIPSTIFRSIHVITLYHNSRAPGFTLGLKRGVTRCFCFLIFFVFLSMSLDFPLLIVASVFSNVYLHILVNCFKIPILEYKNMYI